MVVSLAWSVVDVGMVEVMEGWMSILGDAPGDDDACQEVGGAACMWRTKSDPWYSGVRVAHSNKK